MKKKNDHRTDKLALYCSLETILAPITQQLPCPIYLCYLEELYTKNAKHFVLKENINSKLRDQIMLNLIVWEVLIIYKDLSGMFSVDCNIIYKRINEERLTVPIAGELNVGKKNELCLSFAEMHSVKTIISWIIENIAQKFKRFGLISLSGISKVILKEISWYYDVKAINSPWSAANWLYCRIFDVNPWPRPVSQRALSCEDEIKQSQNHQRLLWSTKPPRLVDYQDRSNATILKSMPIENTPAIKKILN